MSLLQRARLMFHITKAKEPERLRPQSPRRLQNPLQPHLVLLLLHLRKRKREVSLAEFLASVRHLNLMIRRRSSRSRRLRKKILQRLL